MKIFILPLGRLPVPGKVFAAHVKIEGDDVETWAVKRLLAKYSNWFWIKEVDEFEVWCTGEDVKECIKADVADAIRKVRSREHLPIVLDGEFLG